MLTPKDPAEIITVFFDFSALTAAPVNPVVTASRASGAEDNAPQAILNGAPVVSAADVLQVITGGVAACNYTLRCQADAADGSRYVLAGLLPVRVAA